MRVHKTHPHIYTHICTLAFNRSPEARKSQHHPSGWWGGKLGTSSKPTSDMFLHMVVGLPRPWLTSGHRCCSSCSSCCYMCAWQWAFRTKARRCQGRGVPEGHALRETSNWARTQFSKSATADSIRLVPSNVRVAYITRRRATPREGGGGRRAGTGRQRRNMCHICPAVGHPPLFKS